MIAAWHPDPQAAPDIIRARIDRLGALYASAEYAQVIREYQSLIAQQQTVPDWAIGWVISSFIALKQIPPIAEPSVKPQNIQVTSAPRRRAGKYSGSW